MAPINSKKPRVILGLMNFGPDVEWGARITTIPEFNIFLDCLQEYGHNEVDTARQYQRGSQEAFTAEAKWKERGLKVATKIYPTSPGLHEPSTLSSMFHESLKQLETESVDIFYLHAADRSIPFTQTLEMCDKLHREGKFKQLGLSNFTAFEVAEIAVTCKERGWVRPRVYQGMYNAITRGIEPELVIACRRYGLDIVVYNPLAGGFFTGKYKSPTASSATEAASSETGSLKAETKVGQVYRARYFNDAYFEALQLIEPVAKSHNLTLVEVALRWLVHHSALKILNGNDGIILGASKVEQLQECLLDIEKEPLPKEVLDVLDEAWEITKVKAPTYWHLDLKYTYDFYA